MAMHLQIVADLRVDGKGPASVKSCLTEAGFVTGGQEVGEQVLVLQRLGEVG